MRSSNFLPSLNQSTPRNNIITNANNVLTSPHARTPHNKNSHDPDIKLENRVFYVEKATARLIHAFESIGSRLTKIESDQNNTNLNISALSKAIHALKESNKEFVSKQNIITERLVADIHKTTHRLSQQASFINKEVSDIRDSMQILSGNLQKNFNEGIKAAMKQCNELNVQNSNCITSLRTITDQKVSHLQQLIVDSQKRAQSQNASILDIINSNQKNQAEFQKSFKLFFEKFRDSMHQNLSALQESSQEQISYLDNVLRAEVKTRMKNTQTQNQEIDNKIFEIQEIMNQNKRDIQRSCEYITKDVESVKEQQKHQQNATQPLHKLITNLTKQFDENSHQHLTDIKSMMQLNQDTADKQFNQIKSLQIQIQQMWSKISNQQHEEVQHFNGGISSPQHLASIASPNERNPYLVRPQSYKSDMSSTAAFNAIKHHLANMPRKPAQDEEDVIFNQHSEYIHGDNEISDIDTSKQMEAAQSEFQQLSVHNSPRPANEERLPVNESEAKVVDNDENVEEQDENDYDDEYENEIEDVEKKENDDEEYENDAVDVVDVENDATSQNIAEKESSVNIDNLVDDEPTTEKESSVNIEDDIDNLLEVEPTAENVVEKESEAEKSVDVEEDIDNLLDDEPVAVDNDEEKESAIESNVDADIDNNDAENVDDVDSNPVDDIDDILGNDETNDDNKPPASDNYSEEYSEDNTSDKVSEQQKKENEDVEEMEKTENTIDIQEKEQNESNVNEIKENDVVQDDIDNDQYSDF